MKIIYNSILNMNLFVIKLMGIFNFLLQEVFPYQFLIHD